MADNEAPVVESAPSTETNVDVSNVDTTSQQSFSFDELDNILSEGKSDEKIITETEKAEKVAKKAEKEAKKDEISFEESAKSEESEDKDNNEEDKEDKEDKKEEPKEEIKKVKGSFKGDSLEIPVDAVVKHTVDGKEIEIPIKELLNNYAGKVPWDKKYTELAKERNAFKQEVKVVEQYINNFREMVQKNDMPGALSFFAEFAGTSPLEFKKQLREAMFPQFEQLSKMNEEQKKLFEMKEENDFLKKKTESELQKQQAQQAHSRLEQELLTIQETHKISDQDLVTAYDELVANYKGEITPSLIAEYHGKKMAYEKTESLLTKVDPSHLQDASLVDQLAKLVEENPNFDDNDWAEVLQSAFGVKQKPSKSEVLSQKVKKNVINQSNQGSAPKSVISFDEL